MDESASNKDESRSGKTDTGTDEEVCSGGDLGLRIYGYDSSANLVPEYVPGIKKCDNTYGTMLQEFSPKLELSREEIYELGRNGYYRDYSHLLIGREENGWMGIEPVKLEFYVDTTGYNNGRTNNYTT